MSLHGQKAWPLHGVWGGLGPWVLDSTPRPGPPGLQTTMEHRAVATGPVHSPETLTKAQLHPALCAGRAPLCDEQAGDAFPPF